MLSNLMGFPDGAVIRNLPANRRRKRHGFNPWVGKIPWSRKQQPTPVLPGKFQRSLAGYSSQELDTKRGRRSTITTAYQFWHNNIIFCLWCLAYLMNLNNKLYEIWSFLITFVHGWMTINFWIYSIIMLLF